MNGKIIDLKNLFIEYSKKENSNSFLDELSSKKLYKGKIKYMVDYYFLKYNMLYERLKVNDEKYYMNISNKVKGNSNKTNGKRKNDSLGKFVEKMVDDEIWVSNFCEAVVNTIDSMTNLEINLILYIMFDYMEVQEILKQYSDEEIDNIKRSAVLKIWAELKKVGI